MSTYTSLYGTHDIQVGTANCQELYIDGTAITFNNFFNKAIDDTDDIVEGKTNKFDHITTSLPIVRTANDIAIPIATALQDGYLDNADFAVFHGKEDVLTFNAPLSRSVNTVSLPKATTSVDGYLSATDFTAFSASSGWTTISGPYLENDYTIKMKTGTALYQGAYTVIGANREIVGKSFTLNDGVSPFDAVTTGGNIVGNGYYKNGDATALIDVSKNGNFNSVKINSTTVVDSSRNGTFKTLSWDGTGSGGTTGQICDIYGALSGISLVVGGTTVIDGSTNFNGNMLSINSTPVIDSSKNVSADSYKINGTTIVNSSRNATFNDIRFNSLTCPGNGITGTIPLCDNIANITCTTVSATSTMRAFTNMRVSGLSGGECYLSVDAPTSRYGNNATTATLRGLVYSTILECLEGEGAGIIMNGDYIQMYQTFDNLGIIFTDEDSGDLANTYVSYINSSGNLIVYSSQNAKFSIRKKQHKNYLDRINQLNVYSYAYKYQINDNDREEQKERKYWKNKKLTIGFVAEEVNNLFDNCSDGYKTITVDGDNKEEFNNLTKNYVPKCCEEEVAKKKNENRQGPGVNYNSMVCYSILALQELTEMVNQQQKLLKAKDDEIILLNTKLNKIASALNMVL